MKALARPSSAFVAGAFLAFLVGGFAGYALPRTGETFGERDSRAEGDYRFISPLLECAELDTLSPGEVRQVREEVEGYIDTERKLGHASEVAIYFRDLNNGPWFGIGDDVPYTPGSLVKVPLLMSALREEEMEPGFLARQVAYRESGMYAVPTIIERSPLKVGIPYPLSELARVMVVYSDNAAAELVHEALGTPSLNETFTTLGLAPLPLDKDHEITVRQYSTFFRVLFNATYLSPDMSERALSMLTETEFKEGLVAGVPAGVVVAHKFGEREVGAATQLHDCGIVYAPGKPYTLCIMTRGDNLAELTGIIEGISRIVYRSMAL